MNQNERKTQQNLANMGTASRMEAHNQTRRMGGTPREAILSYCQGNKWLMENARAVGNLPPGC